MYVAPPMSHATSAFAVAAFLLLLAARPRHVVACGGMALLGISPPSLAMVREQDAFFVVGPGPRFRCGRCASATRASAPAASVCRRRRGRRSQRIVYLPQALAYVALNGHLGPSHLVARKMSWIGAARARGARLAGARLLPLDAAGARRGAWADRARVAPGARCAHRARGARRRRSRCRCTWPAASSPGRLPAPSASAGS